MSWHTVLEDPYLLVEIFKYLELEDLSILTCVCKEWYSINLRDLIRKFSFTNVDVWKDKVFLTFK